MSSSRLEILCSPCPTDNAFVTWGSDLSLYRVEEFNQTSLLDDADFEHKSGFFRLSDRFFAYTVGRTKEFKFIKHVAWCPRSAGHYLPQMPPPIIAVGLTSGQVILTSFSQTLETDIYLGGSASSGSDITAPKYQRQCNGLSFNGSDPTLLAAGFDRHRNDYAVVVWDASRAIANAANSSSTSIFLNSTSTGFGAGFRATMEVGLSEQCNSLTWMCSQPKTLAAGMNGKHLKFYDLRDNLKQVQTSAPTKGVNGVCVDPFFEFRLASYASDGGIMIWDRRNFERPIYTVGEGPAGSKPTMGSASSSSSQSGGVQICKLGWCPTRSGLLAACSKDSAMIRLYDVHSDNTKEGGVHNVLERMEWPGKPSASPIVSFTWNAGPSVRHLLALTADGSILDHQVSERITVSWSPEPELAWTEGTNSLYVLSKVTGGKSEQPSTAAPTQGLPFTYPIQVECKEYFDDISVIMKTRAKMQYGLKTVSLSDNGEMVNDPQLRIAWDWMELSRRLQLDRYSRSGSQTNTSYWASVPASNTAPNFQKWSSKNQGVRWILCGESGKSIAQKSEAVEAPWIGLELGPRTVLARVYQSEARTFCLRMCGWGFDRGGSSLNLFLDKLTGNRQYERAAAIAVFHLHVSRAMQILQEGGSKGHSNKARPLHLVAMALAGFTDDRNSLWRETCTRLKTELNEPYLSALFTFLTADPDRAEVVLNERMAVKDKVAFALTFLSDAKLYDYITKLTDKLTDRGSLDGLLLTGLAVSVVNSGPPNQLQDSSTTATRTTTMTDPFTGQLLTVNTSVSSDVHGPPSDPLLATPTNQPAPYLQQTGVPVFTGTSAIASIAYTTTTVSTAVSAIAGGNAMAAGSSNSGSSPGTQGLAASGPIITSNEIASGLTLLQNYVDRTGDVQTAALMALHAEVLTDERANMWLQTYRNLLDSWSYWNERCLCDVEATKLDPSSKCPPQIYVCCTFCGRGISPSVIKSLGTQRSMYFRMQAHNQAGKTKLSACPSCRKPLPRCSLCQVHLGTASGVQDMLASFHGGHSATSPTSGYAASHRSPSKALSPASVLNPIPLQTSHHRGSFDSVIAPLGLSEATRRKLSPMDSWFTWCQSCRHGGHANHILRWFKENEDCPVTGCSCKCLSLDPVGPKRSPVKRNVPAAINPEALIDGIASALASQGITNAVSSRF